MSRDIFPVYDENPYYKGPIMLNAKKYTFFNFLVDVALTCCTCGFWLIWIFVREIRNH